MNSPPITTHYNELRYLPMIVGVLSPFSIIMSLPPILSEWKVNKHKAELSYGLTIVLTSSVVSLLLGYLCLLLRFLEKRIVLNTWGSIILFSIHGGIMAGTILHFVITNPNLTSEDLTGEFYGGIVVTILSFLSGVMLMTDYFRYDKLRYYGSGISNRQRNFVFFCIFVMLWAAMGGWIFSYFEDWSFIEGVYFTLVTMSTIGFGDLVAHKTGTRIFLFFYAAIGMVAMGIFINSIRIVLLETLEEMYLSKLNKFISKQNFTSYEARKKSTQEILLKERETLLYRQLQFAILSMLIFWFSGAGLFLLVEPQWTYFNALYFCFVSFTTIGYGDVIPINLPGILLFIGYSLLGLVAATYLISIATELWSVKFEKRVTHINLKQQRKINSFDLENSTTLSPLSNQSTLNDPLILDELTQPESNPSLTWEQFYYQLDHLIKINQSSIIKINQSSNSIITDNQQQLLDSILELHHQFQSNLPTHHH